jgi:SPP1 gp7 family putative phage head morphogenesis protein
MASPVRLSFSLPFREAIAAAESRRVVLPSEFYGRLQDTARVRAATIGKLAELTQIRTVLDSLTNALANGVSLAQWRKEMLANWPEDDLPTKAYLSTVYRTNAQSAYTAGLWRQFQANRDRRPYLMYSAINDERTRPAHRAMSGHIAHIDDSLWREWTPPCGFNCRCTLISLSAREAVDRGYGKQERPNVHPDPGFGASVSDLPDVLDRELKDAIGRMPEVIASVVRAQVPPPVLADALAIAVGASLAAVAAHVAGLFPRYQTEAIAIADYLRSQQTVTSALRGDLTEEETVKQGARVAAIQQAAGLLPEFDGTAYRAVSSTGFLPGEFERFVEAHTEVGSVVQWQAPALATLEQTQGNIHFTIHAARALDVGELKWNRDDPSVLFVAGATFRVVSAKEVSGQLWRWEVELEEVAADATKTFATDAVTHNAITARFRRSTA